MDKLETDKHSTTRPAIRRSWAAIAGLATLLLCGAALIPTSALAVNFSLDIEFDDGITGNFGNAEVIENGGELDFTITLTDELGSGADLHRFYFNLTSAFSGLGIKGTNAPSNGSDYVLLFDPSVAGGAGSSFDYGINLGSGAGKKGNGKLKTASFTLFASQALTLADLLGSSFASGNSIEIFMAVHVQGTSLVESASSETLGSIVPEPSTGLLMMMGLALLGQSRRRNG